MAELLAYDTGDDSAALQYGDEEVAQSFTPTSHWNVTSIEIKIYRVGSPAASNGLTLYTTDANGHPDQVIRGIGIPTAGVSDDTNGVWYTVTFPGGQALSNNTKYAIRLSGGDNAGVYLGWRFDNNDATYVGGDRIHSTDGGTTWVNQSGDDLMFRINGTVTYTAPADIVTTKRLIVAGNSNIYYEDSAGSLIELDTSADPIDTTDQTQIFGGFQKAFVVNGTTLKVADFINTKIIDDSGFTNTPAKGDIVYQNGTSPAVMVVDYVNTTDKVMYGYVTSGIFEVTTAITTVVSGGGDTIFPSPSAPVSSPHWYDWTVYPGGASGTMPASAYIGCLYRGRCVLSGNPNYPNQWYMSKIADPWMWDYVSTDPLTAVSGQNADAGEIGDVVRVIISYGDDFLVFGCANSISILDGDPAAGGSIDQIDDTTGIFGPYAWCKDGQGNLYFWGAGGLYKMMGGRSKPMNISQGNLPKWVDDWATNPSTHRIVLSYDPFRNGIIVSRTTFSDGTNLNYYYDLKLEAFFPETYPEECAIYSSLYYDANSSLRNLIVGGKDGYIREFVDTAKSDDIGDSNEAISSYVTLPMVKLGIEEDDDVEGKLTSLTIELAGGLATTKLTHTALTTAHAKGDVLTQATSDATMVVHSTDTAKENTFGHTLSGTFNTTNQVTGSGDGSAFTPTVVGTGSFTDTDGVSYELHIGDDAETVCEDIEDGATAFASGTLSGTGRKTRIRTRARGRWLGIKLYNSTDAETWAVNLIAGTIKPAGRIR